MSLFGKIAALFGAPTGIQAWGPGGAPKVKKGLLHEKMGIKQGHKISEGALDREGALAKRTHNVTLAREVGFAKAAKHWHHHSGAHDHV